MSFELQFPSGGGYTNNWVPSHDPTFQGTQLSEVSGIIAERMAEVKQIYGYRISEPFAIYTYSFENMSDTDRTNLVAFQAVVGSGAFDFKEGSCGVITAYRKVTFAPEGFQRTWRRTTATAWGVTIVLSDSL